MIDEKQLLKALQGFYEREEEYKRVADENNIDYEPQTGLIDEIIKYVQKMQKFDEWTPCDEKLPVEGRNVLVTRNYGLFDSTTGEFKKHQEVTIGRYEYSDWWDHHGMRTDGIVAWQWLPKPWEGKPDEL